jgi:hypothetical protein
MVHTIFFFVFLTKKMSKTEKVNLGTLKEIAEKGVGYYVGGTNGSLQERLAGHDKVTIGTVYAAKTSDVKYDEDKLLQTSSAKKNTHEVSNCDNAPGVVYVACKSEAETGGSKKQ